MVSGRSKGFIFLGLTEGIKECQKAMETGKDVSAMVGAMSEKNFDFARLK